MSIKKEPALFHAILPLTVLVGGLFTNVMIFGAGAGAGPNQTAMLLASVAGVIIVYSLKYHRGELELIGENRLVEKAMTEISHHEIAGFDTETRPAFVSGTVYKVALAQAATENKMYLFRLPHTGIPDAIHTFFENEKITKAGIAFRDDLKSLQKIRNFTANVFFDLATVSKPAGFDASGIKKPAALLLKVRISKGAQTSHWEAGKLNEKQIRYTAAGAWISLKIHEKIMTLAVK